MSHALTPFVSSTRQTRRRKRLLAALTSVSMLGLLVLVSPASPATADEGDYLSFSSNPASTTAGSLLGDVTVQVFDGTDVPATGSTAKVTLTLAVPAGATLHGGEEAAVSGGEVTFSNLWVDKAGTYTLLATDTSGQDFPASSATSTPFTISAADPDHLKFDVQPSTTRAGDAPEDAMAVVKVGVYDEFGNLTNSNDTEVSLDTSGGSPNLFPDQPATATSLNGTAEFDDLHFHLVGTGYTLEASSGTLTGATSDPFDITPGAIHHFQVTGTPSSAVAGTPFSLTVTAYDAFDNVKTDYDGTIHFDSSDIAPHPASLPEDFDFDGSENGTHTFTDGVTLFNTTTQSVTVTHVDLLDETPPTGSKNIPVAPGPIHHFTVDAPPSTTAGDPFSVTVTAYDAYDNVKTDYGGTPIFTSSDVAPFAATLPSGYAFVPATDNGVHVFTGLKLYNTTSQTVTVTDSLVATATGTDTVAVTPAALDHFVWAPITGVKPAGSGFGVSVTAYDAYDNVKTDYTGGATLSGLADSPNGSHPAYSAIAWGAGTGVGTATVTPKAATVTDTVSGVAAETAKLTITDGTVTKQSGGFAVSPLLVTTLTFTGQPIDTQVNTPIYSVCAPSTTTPCATSLASVPSTPVSVYAVDTFGNPVMARPIAITGGINSPSSVSVSTSNGTASFGDSLKRNTTTTGSGVTLLATATGSGVTRTSNNFRVVTTLKGCQGQSCLNKALGQTSSKTYVNGWSQITTTGNFFDTGTNTNVIQSTQLEVKAGNSPCGSGSNITWISDAVDQRVTGSNAQVTNGGLALIVIPKNTLKNSGVLSRGTPSFNICFGAIWIGPGTPSTPWRAKTSATNSTLKNAVRVADPTVVPQGERYYGIPADCGAAGLPASSPCIYLRTKKKSDIQAALGADAASIMTDSDVGIIVKVTGSWDGRSQPF